MLFNLLVKKFDKEFVVKALRIGEKLLTRFDTAMYVWSWLVVYPIETSFDSESC